MHKHPHDESIPWGHCSSPYNSALVFVFKPPQKLCVVSLNCINSFALPFPDCLLGDTLLEQLFVYHYFFKYQQQSEGVRQFHHSCCFRYFPCTYFSYSMSFFFVTHHTSFAIPTLLHAARFLRPSPPYFLGVQTVSHEIDEGLLYSVDPPKGSSYIIDLPCQSHLVVR